MMLWDALNLTAANFPKYFINLWLMINQKCKHKKNSTNTNGCDHFDDINTTQKKKKRKERKKLAFIHDA